MQVVAAVIERNDLILICQRRKGARHELKWEFPGGKVEPGESPPQALARELREELKIEASINRELHRQSVRYGNGPEFHLIFCLVTEFQGEPVNTEFEQIVWERREKLADYDFLDGDREFVRRLAANLFNS
jgi:8-oxo-dGTP diphosphatase